MFNNKRIADLEIKLAKREEEIREMKDEIVSLKRAVIVETGEFEKQINFGELVYRWSDVEKTAPVNKVIRAIVEHLGLQIEVIAEQTMPERVTVQAIDAGKKQKK